MGTFTNNYPLNGGSFFAKRIIVDDEWTGVDLINKLEEVADKELPFYDDFSGDKGWIKSWGDMLISEEGLILADKSLPDLATGADLVFLDGSYSWKNYNFEIEIDSEDAPSFSILAGYKNIDNYFSCQFGDDNILIKSMKNGSEQIINNVTVDKLYERIKSGKKISIEMSKNSIKCLVDGRSFLTVIVSEEDTFGGIGFGSNDNKNSTIIIKNISVSPLENNMFFVCQDGKLCELDTRKSIFSEIYNTYPLLSDQKETIYKTLSEGNLKKAESILQNIYEVERYDPIKIDQINWENDPYNEPYWRFNFYSLQPIRDLLFAWNKTGDEIYKNKTIEITESFIDKGMDRPYSWDKHGTSFRTMLLVDVWWELRAKNSLSPVLSEKILKALEKHGKFLADESNFESHYNHGVDQSLALYLLAVNFPNLPSSEYWLKLAKRRIIDITNEIIDDDGVLVENSPYYHFYVLDKYWDFYKYLKNQNLSLGTENDKQFFRKVEKMISYGALILQPDLEIPLLGASLQKKLAYSGIYKEMAEISPEFLYILTQGELGKAPKRKNINYPAAGQTIMRSGWGADDIFKDQTQIVFDIGAYRTNHSDLDALSFSLFGIGINLMPDSGLYTYENDFYRSYFHGTRAHNTVTVDGLDQKEGSAKPGSFIEGNGFIYQSASSDLYDGVIHDRAILLIKKNLVLIIDYLKSRDVHNYEQIFHLSPTIDIEMSGNNVIGLDKKNNKKITIHQVMNSGTNLKTEKEQKDPLSGVCSIKYEKYFPCWLISYSKNTDDAKFVTLLEIGEEEKISDIIVKDASDKNISLIIEGEKSVLVNVNGIFTSDEAVIIK